MLRQIVLASLAMTTCATLIPIKADAAFLTFTRRGPVLAKEKDLITLRVSLDPEINPEKPENSLLQLTSFKYDYDRFELKLVSEEILYAEPPKKQGISLIDRTREIAVIIFEARKDLVADLGNPYGDFYDLEAGYEVVITKVPGIAKVKEDTVDIVPIPEPLTIFGTATAFICGTLFKRKSFKNKKN